MALSKRMIALQQKLTPFGEEKARDHQRLVDRLQDQPMSYLARSVYDLIRHCAALTRRGKLCGHPLCPSCGTQEKNQIAEQLQGQIRQAQNKYGQDHVSALTVNDVKCLPQDIVIYAKAFRQRLQNTFDRHLRSASLFGEFELAPDTWLARDEWERLQDELAHIEELSFSARRTGDEEDALSVDTAMDVTLDRQILLEGVSELLAQQDLEVQQEQGGEITTGSPQLKYHLHAVCIHPRHSRAQIKAILEQAFTTHLAVKITPITDNLKYGRIRDGILTWLQYCHDKSSAVKGGLRKGSTPDQLLAFEGYVALAGGSRRRARVVKTPKAWKPKRVGAAVVKPEPIRVAACLPARPLLQFITQEGHRF